MSDWTATLDMLEGGYNKAAATNRHEDWGYLQRELLQHLQALLQAARERDALREARDNWKCKAKAFDRQGYDVARERDALRSKLEWIMRGSFNVIQLREENASLSRQLAEATARAEKAEKDTLIIAAKMLDLEVAARSISISVKHEIDAFEEYLKSIRVVVPAASGEGEKP